MVSFSQTCRSSTSTSNLPSSARVSSVSPTDPPRPLPRKNLTLSAVGAAAPFASAVASTGSAAPNPVDASGMNAINATTNGVDANDLVVNGVAANYVVANNIAANCLAASTVAASTVAASAVAASAFAASALAASAVAASAYEGCDGGEDGVENFGCDVAPLEYGESWSLASSSGEEEEKEEEEDEDDEEEEEEEYLAGMISAN